MRAALQTVSATLLRRRLSGVTLALCCAVSLGSVACQVQARLGQQASERSFSQPTKPVSFALFAAAQAHFAADRLPEASEGFQLVLRQSPKHADALRYLARVAILQKQYADALRWFAELLQAHPDDAEAQFMWQLFEDAQRLLRGENLQQTQVKHLAGRLLAVRVWNLLQLPLDSSLPAVLEAPVASIVTLGARINADGSPSARLASRLHKTWQLAQHYPEVEVLLSGAGNAAHNEAEIMAHWLRARGLAPARLRLESESRDTLENAVFSLQLARAAQRSQMILISDERHVQRARVIFLETARVQHLENFTLYTAASPYPTQESRSPAERTVECLDTFRDAARVHGFWLKPGLFN